MVTFLPKAERETFGSVIGRGLGSGISQGLQQGIEDERKLKSEEKYLKLQGEYQRDLLDYQSKLNKQQREDEIDYQIKQANKSSDIKKAPQDTFELNPERKSKSSESTKEITANKKLPVLNPDQIEETGIQLAQRYRDNGISKTDEEGIQEVAEKNQQNFIYNNNLDLQESNKRARQQSYGQEALQKLAQVFPDPSLQLQGIFQKKGEDLAESGKSEAEISKGLAKEATDLKNKFSLVERSIGPARSHTSAADYLLGTSRADLKKQQDVRIKLNPLLELGLYDDARNILQKLGYEPEERENLVSSLGEYAKKELAQFPKTERKSGFLNFEKPFQKQELQGKQKEIFINSLSNIIKSDPSVNLVLLRKAYEDKGVDWNEFKDAINEEIVSGNLKLNQDQMNALDYLDSPPENYLNKALRFFKLSGR